MQTTENLLIVAKREAVLKLVASVIHELTINIRCFYDEPDGLRQIKASNEAIHRLSGHLRDLTNPEELLTTSRAEAVVSIMRMLPLSTIARVESHCPL